MSRSNNSRAPSEIREIPEDCSLWVATKSDILFRPILDSGKQLLNYKIWELKKNIKDWAAKRGLGPEIDDASDVKYLRSLDPVEWKEQDHYAVMGLQHMRFRATEEDMKKAYRLRVLRHHPDKRQAAGEAVIADSDYFACIVKAYEVLGNVPKKRAYDSVDPKFDDYIPSKNVSSDNEFYKVYGDWFELNSRWSNNQPVPLLGSFRTPREKVEQFYSFWYEFDSWREYSYLDEEDKEKGQYREERRWIDKQNKQARAKLKKEEMARIRTVVDNAYNCDPRIKNFRAEDNQKKLDKKMARQNALKQKQQEEQKLREEAELIARLEREKIEAEEKEKELASKKEKEAFKKAMKRERKNLRTICKENQYYALGDDDIVANMTSVEQLCEILPLNELEELSKKLASLNLEESRQIFLDKVGVVLKKIQTEKKESVQGGPTTKIGNGVSNHHENDWSHEDISLLTKAVNLFPAGTIQRWEVVANFVYQHSNGNNKKQRSAKEVLAKAKDLKGADFSKNVLKDEANAKAFDFFEKSVKNIVPTESEATKRVDDVAETNGLKKVKSISGGDGEKIKNSASAGEIRSWTPEDQKLLEQALKTYPTSVADRWDRIADCVPGRTKKECMARFKEIAALVKAKKSAQSTVTAVKK